MFFHRFEKKDALDKSCLHFNLRSCQDVALLPIRSFPFLKNTVVDVAVLNLESGFDDGGWG